MKHSVPYGKETKMKRNALIAFFIIAAILFVWALSGRPKKAAEKNILKPVPVKIEKNIPVAYDMSKIKRQPTSMDENKPADLKEMYNGCQKSDVGDNMVEGWAKMAPEQKAKLKSVFDDQIKKSEEALRINKEDKHAKNILYMSQALKKMADYEFNYKLKNKK